MTTVVSRLELDHPDLGEAGGSTLHAEIEAIYKKIGDNIDTRFFYISALGNGSTTTVEHNFHAAVANLRYDLYLWNTSTQELTLLTSGSSPALSSFSIAATTSFETTKLDVTNSSGSSRNLVLTVFQDPIQLDELTDVDTTSVPPVDKDTLNWNAGSSAWKPGVPVIGRYAIATKTSDYTATIADDLILVDTGSGAVNITLPAATATGKGFWIEKITTDTNAVTITRAGSDTIEGGPSAGATTTKCHTPNEGIFIVANGVSKWYIKERKYKDGWTNFTMTVGATTTPPTKGTVNTDKAYWKRVKGGMIISYHYSQTGAGSAGSGTYLYPIPFSGAVDTNVVTIGTSSGDDFASSLYTGTVNGGGTRSYFAVSLGTTTDFRLLAGTGGFFSSGDANFNYGNTQFHFAFCVEVPISGWN